MNAVPKLVATRTLTDTSAWVNSRAIDGDLTSAVKRARLPGDPVGRAAGAAVLTQYRRAR
jgi:hypothetical protein